MRSAHLDCAAGLSGEMLVGALVDAGASLERIQDAVDLLGFGDVRITFGRVRRAGVEAVSVRIRPPQDTLAPSSWRAVRSILEDAGLPDGVRDRAHAVFRCLAEAEAAQAGVAVDDLRLPDIPTLDALGDVVGACAGIVDLGLSPITAGPVPHGREHLVTPTGAALLAALTQPASPAPAFDVERVGVGAGAGAGDLAYPHVLRLLLGRDDQRAHARTTGAGARDPHVEPTP